MNEDKKEAVVEVAEKAKKRTKSFLEDFKEFALRGDVMSLAVGIIIGGAFQGVVNSLTTNILSPLIGLVAGANFDQLKLAFLGVTVAYGAFITTLINFVIMAFVVFLLIRFINKLANIGSKDEGGEDIADMKPCPHCKKEISKQATRCPYCTSELIAEK
jgi:large conductance mechanosensitive channel